jgi:hypothetical protein
LLDKSQTLYIGQNNLLIYNKTIRCKCKTSTSKTTLIFWSLDPQALLLLANRPQRNNSRNPLHQKAKEFNKKILILIILRKKMLLDQNL